MTWLREFWDNFRCAFGFHDFMVLIPPSKHRMWYEVVCRRCECNKVIVVMDSED